MYVSLENLIEGRVYMDKESLALLISALTEMEIVELYKIKKINNFGFRANTINDVRKNRKVLEGNLLKPINMKRVQGYFVLKAANLEINIEGLELNELKELCESKGYTKVLITLYVKGNKEDFRKIVLHYLEKPHEEPLNSKNKTDVEESVLENKFNKTIKKLETKLKNITEESQKKENNYKLELENANKLIIDLRKENMRLKQGSKQICKENNQYKNENVNLRNLNDTIQKQNENYSSKLKKIEKEVILLREKIILLDDKKQISNNNNFLDIKDVNTIITYKIAVLGEFNELISDMNGIHFEFIVGKEIKRFTIDGKSPNYNEIWIIHYDLTQKEKQIVQMKNFKSNLEVKIRDIYSLKELNQAIINLKKN